MEGGGGGGAGGRGGGEDEVGRRGSMGDWGWGLDSVQLAS